ncbi:MAG: DUF2799 domain-containing protein, partial [Wenzhouxiangella sp.]|nr:DUF2799 domain-containing protein [Wenzhouxiangella sp.]
AWRAGRSEGLIVFCTAESGWRRGRDGGGYQKVCDSELEPDFLYGFEIGRELYDVNSRITSLETRIEGLQRRLVEDDLDEEDRRNIRHQLDTAFRDMRGLERQRGDAEAEARNRGFREF